MNIKIVILLALICAVVAVPNAKSLKAQVIRSDEDDSSSSSISDSSETTPKAKPTPKTTPKHIVKSGNAAAAPAPAPAPAPAYNAPKIIKKF